ncbi:MAG: cyanophycinase, partial [Melioribacteraceae bacterium]|nr:cyanophycinase [Melioribacteraceae bacterium]
MKIQNLLFILICTSFLMAENPKGNLVIIGGGKRPDNIIEEIVKLAGGETGNIIVIPNASSDPVDVGTYQANQFREFGPKSAEFILLDEHNVNSDSVLNLFDEVTGVFFSGGNQTRLTKLLLNTKLLRRIKKIYKNGGVIAGTSAGAAVMSEMMITGDEIIHPESKTAFGYIQRNNIETTEGFGFIKRAIIDQHFIYRKRHNRLISLVLENPNLLGIGI